MIVDADRIFEGDELLPRHPAGQERRYLRLQHLAHGVYVGNARLIEEEVGRQKLHGVPRRGLGDEGAASRAAACEDEALRLQRFHRLAYGPLGRLERVDQVALLRKTVARPQSFRADVIFDAIGDRLRSAFRTLGRDEETLAISTGFLFSFR